MTAGTEYCLARMRPGVQRMGGTGVSAASMQDDNACVCRSLRPCVSPGITWHCTLPGRACAGAPGHRCAPPRTTTCLPRPHCRGGCRRRCGHQQTSSPAVRARRRSAEAGAGARLEGRQAAAAGAGTGCLWLRQPVLPPGHIAQVGRGWGRRRYPQCGPAFLQPLHHSLSQCKHPQPSTCWNLCLFVTPAGSAACWTRAPAPATA